jgi:HEAT repeat protein
LVAERAPPEKEEGARRDAFVRAAYAAEMALRKLREPRSVEPLIALLGEQTIASLTAAELLIELADPRAVEPLITALRSADEPVQLRGVAADGLGRLGDSRALEPLIDALDFWIDDEDWLFDVRHAVVIALGDLGDLRAVHALVRTLRDDDEDIADAAANALAQLENPSSTR